MRRIFPLLMLLILASAPVLDGGCFTYNQISSSRKEVWSDLRPPCAAFVGFDGSLTLVLPDGDDQAKARFYAARFSPEEVRAVATPAAKRADMLGAGTLRLGDPAAPVPPLVVGPTVPLHPPEPPSDAIPAPQDPQQVQPSPPIVTREMLLHVTPAPRGELRLSLSRRSPRVTPLSGSTLREWEAGLGQGYWLGSGAFQGFSSQYNPYAMFQFGVPRYLPDTWDMRFMETGDTAEFCRIVRDDGTHMVPTAGQFWVPVTLVADVVTSPIQLVFLIGVAVSK